MSGSVLTASPIRWAISDPIAALGSIIAEELYGKPVPMVVLGEEDFRSISDGDTLSISPDGTVTGENSNPEKPEKLADPEKLDKKV